MNKLAIGVVIGAGIGSLITYFITKDKIQQKADEDIAEMRKYVRERLKEAPSSPVETSDETRYRRVKAKTSNAQEEHDELTDVISENKYNYSDVSKTTAENKEKEPEKRPTIEVISSEDYDRENDCDKISITWYPYQEILADENDERLDLDIIGGELMLKGGFNSDGYKYIRNNQLKAVYEIVLDDENTWVDPNVFEYSTDSRY